MKILSQELNGAWEERGVIGTRVEIDGFAISGQMIIFDAPAPKIVIFSKADER